jgi:protein TonB
VARILSAPAALAVSAALHGAAALALARLPTPAPPGGETVAVEIAAAPPPAPEPPPPPPPAPAPAPAPAPRPAPRAPAPRPEDAPPPPNAAPPPDAAPAAKVPRRIGISMEATTQAGGMAAPAGNTLYGAVPRTAPEPSEVKPYRADRYVPPDEVTRPPRQVGVCQPPREEYPEAARRAQVEGAVVLRLLIDERGNVAEAQVLEDPGAGLGRAAVEALRRHCRFEPATKGDQPVPTTIRFVFRWELRG